MLALIRLLLAILVCPFKPKVQLEAENLALWQQLIVLRRKLPRRVRLTNGDWTLFVWLYRLFSLALGVNRT